MRNYKILIKDVLASMEQIEKFGEAIKLIFEHIRIKYPGVPWKQMAGMRDKLIHGYFTADFKLVWDSIKIEIPRFK
ncbi:MAG: HepT-like ribonuclease domain-containing protein [Actinomycetota bacterium]